MKRILIMLLAASLVFSFVACSEKEEEEKKESVNYEEKMAESVSVDSTQIIDGYIDIYGNQVLAIDEDELYNHSMTLQDGYIVYRENGYCGIKNIEGNIICEPQYTELFYMEG